MSDLVKCDRCGCVAEFNGEGETWQEVDDYDLCMGCYQDFQSWMIKPPKVIEAPGKALAKRGGGAR